MGEIRWEGHSHEELHAQINAGPGVAASHETETAWSDLTKTLHDIDESIHDGLRKLGASWEGAAADEAHGNLTPLAQWASDAGTGANVMKISVQEQAGFIAKARADMPPPVKVTTPAPSGLAVAGALVAGAVAPGIGSLAVDHVVSQQRDHERQEAAKSAGEQKAYDVMRTYQASSTWNANTLGTFNPPPSIVVDVPPPAGGGYSTTPVGMPPGGGGWMPPPVRTGGPGRPGPMPGPGGPGGWVPPPGSGNPGPVPPPVGGPPLGTDPVRYHPGPVSPGSPGGRGGYPSGPGGYPGGPGGVRNPGPYPVAAPPGWGGGAGMSPEEEIARRGGAGGRFGAAGEGAGRVGAAGEHTGRAGGQGRGGTFGVGGGQEEAAARRGTAGAGGRGGSIMQPAVGQGGGGKGEEDGEHHAADYLVENRDIFGDDRMVAPPVIGEDLPEE